MRLADGGFRPAYNMQIVSAPKGQLIVAVDIDTTGSDRGLAPADGERGRQSALQGTLQGRVPQCLGAPHGAHPAMVRGKAKARAVLRWFALAHNMLRTFALRRAAIASAT